MKIFSGVLCFGSRMVQEERKERGRHFWVDRQTCKKVRKATD